MIQPLTNCRPCLLCNRVLHSELQLQSHLNREGRPCLFVAGVTRPVSGPVSCKQQRPREAFSGIATAKNAVTLQRGLPVLKKSKKSITQLVDQTLDTPLHDWMLGLRDTHIRNDQTGWNKFINARWAAICQLSEDGTTLEYCERYNDSKYESAYGYRGTPVAL